MSAPHPGWTDVISFWVEAGPKAWFKKDAAFDATIRARFENLHLGASRRELDDWLDTGEGCLALLLLLDQFPRNMYRGSAHAFATDPLARMVARHMVEREYDRDAPEALRYFCYLPFEHSEAMSDQDECVRLVRSWIESGGDAGALRWVTAHYDVIARFGRFPHRNAALGRATTAEEQALLRGGGFAG